MNREYCGTAWLHDITRMRSLQEDGGERREVLMNKRAKLKFELEAFYQDDGGKIMIILQWY
jgi:hypothetical protein